MTRGRGLGLLATAIIFLIGTSSPAGAAAMDGDGDWWDNHVLAASVGVTAGNIVALWETALGAQYADTGHVNGSFQVADDWLTRQFQADHGISVDGRVG